MMNCTMDESTTPPIMMGPAITVSWFRDAGLHQPPPPLTTSNRTSNEHDFRCSGISRGQGQLSPPSRQEDQGTSTNVSWTPTLSFSSVLEIIDQVYDIALSSTTTDKQDDDFDSSCLVCRGAGNESDHQLFIDDLPGFMVTTYRRDLLTDNLGMFEEQFASFRQAETERKNRRSPGAQQ